MYRRIFYLLVFMFSLPVLAVREHIKPADGYRALIQKSNRNFIDLYTASSVLTARMAAVESEAYLFTTNLLPLSGGTMSGDIDMGGLSITNVVTLASENQEIDMDGGVFDGTFGWRFQQQPTIPGYLTSAGAAANYLPLTGGSVSGELKIDTIKPFDSQGGTEGYINLVVDDEGVFSGPWTFSQQPSIPGYLPLAGGTMATEAVINMGEGTISNINYVGWFGGGEGYISFEERRIEGSEWSFAQQPSIPGYLTSTGAAATYLPLAGGTMAGNIDMNEYALTDVITIGSFATLDEYIDFEEGSFYGNWTFQQQPYIPGYLPLNGGTLTNSLTISRSSTAATMLTITNSGTVPIGLRADLGGGGTYLDFNRTSIGGGDEYTFSDTIANFHGNQITNAVIGSENLNNLSVIAGSGLGVVNNQLVVTAGGAGTFESLTGNQFSLGNSSVTNISNTATGAFVAARVTGANSIGGQAYGAIQHGWIQGTAIIGNSAYGASQQGRVEGTAIISNSAYGASQQGHILGTASIGDFAHGASQQGNIFGSASIGDFAYGASQQGLIPGTAIIGDFAVGASQQGFLQPSSTATNNAVGAIQIMGGVNGEVYTTTSTGYGSLLLGPGTQTNAYGILANGLIESKTGFKGDGQQITNIVFPAEELTGNRFSLGNSSVTNISNTATGAFVAARVTGANSIGDRAYGASQHGWIQGTAIIGNSAYGASQQGRVEGTAIISNSAYGASQQGHIPGTASIGDFAYGASQQGLIPGTASIGERAYGASQQGLIPGTAIIGDFAAGASQQGFLQPSSTATNNAVGAIQIMGGVNGEVYTTTSTGYGSLLLGPGTQTNAYGILANGLIESKTGFKGDGQQITNFPALVVTTNNLSTIAGSGLGAVGNQLSVTNVATFESLTGNRMLLGSGTLSFIETNAIGASQMGNFGNVKIGSAAYGASQHGVSILGSMEIKALSYGASQRGEFNSPATIGSLAPGAMQVGSLTSGSATNNGAGAIQLIGGGGTYLTTDSADGSLLLGPGTNNVAYSVKAAGGFYGGFNGNAAGLTNFPALVVTTNNLSNIAGSGLGVVANQLVVTNVAVFVDPPASNTDPGSAGQIAYDNTNFFLYNVASSKWLKVNGVLEW